MYKEVELLKSKKQRDRVKESARQWLGNEQIWKKIWKNLRSFYNFLPKHFMCFKNKKEIMFKYEQITTYWFILGVSNSQLICLISSQYMVLGKSHSVKCEYKTKHTYIKLTYLQPQPNQPPFPHDSHLNMARPMFYTLPNKYYQQQSSSNNEATVSTSYRDFLWQPNDEQVIPC